MASDNPQFAGGLKAGADLSASANQYKLVKLDASGDVVLCGVAGEAAIGSLYNTPASGEAAKVAIGGLVKVQAGASLNEMDPVTPASDGQAVAANKADTDTSDSGAAADALVGDQVFGRVFTAPGGAAEIFTCLVTQEGAIPTTLG